MKPERIVLNASLLAVIGACAPTNEKAVQSDAGLDAQSEIHSDSQVGETSVETVTGGLGPIVYNEENRRGCERRARTGSRIFRNECVPQGKIKTFDGLLGEQMDRAPANQRRVGK